MAKQKNQKKREDNHLNALDKNKIKNIKQIKSSKLLILFLYLINILYSNEQIIYSSYSYITLKITNKIGNSNIINNGYNDCGKSIPSPDEIYINGIKQSIIRSNYSFNESNNTIQLIWKKEFTTCRCMFYKCSNIEEIDLSNFNSSLIDNTLGMFG